jgi:hypothetical protein
VRLTSPSRRVFGFLAAGTIGLSTALLGVTGVAHADPADPAAAADGGVLAVNAAPNAPTIVDVQGDDATLYVWFDQNDPADTDPIDWADDWEYNLDGGSWLPATVDESSGYGSFEIASGLTNGTTYAVRVRGVSGTSGPGSPSDPMSGTPYKPIGAPGAPTVVVGPSSLKVTWTGSAAGTYPIAGYEVQADIPAAPGAQSWSPTTICKTGPAATSCTAPIQAGRAYTIDVYAVDSKGNDGETATVKSDVVPNPAVPATVPTKNGDLTLPAGAKSTVAPGKTITVSGSGYAPNTTITLAIYSTPQVLTTTVTDASGNFTATVTVPAGLAAGNHTLVASGVDSSGNPRYVNLAVTVSSSGKAMLAYTGADVALPSIVGLVGVSLGAGLIIVRRRAARSAA